MTDSNKDEILLPTSPSYLERIKVIGILTSVLALIIYLSQEILPGIIAIYPVIFGTLVYHFYRLFTDTGKKGGKKISFVSRMKELIPARMDMSTNTCGRRSNAFALKTTLTSMEHH